MIRHCHSAQARLSRPSLSHYNMNNSILLSLALLLTATSPGFAAEKKSAQKTDIAAPAAKPDADNYPLKTCVVSNEALGDDFISYPFHQAGKPDRIIRFCCEGCIDDFKADPAKFLKKLDDAAAEQAKAGKQKKK